MPSVKCGFIDKIVWEALPHASCELADSIHIWRLQLSANLHLVNNMASILSVDEVVRANSYLQEKDKNRFILSRGILRLILSKYFSEHAESIRFAVGENKKPFVQSHSVSLHYNIAHAGDWVLIAVSNSPVGIDIEHINSSFDFIEILPLCFSNDEVNFIQSRESFYLLWTRKEALVKATGKGIDNDMPFVPCMDGMYEVSSEKIGSDKDWAVVSFEMGEQYVSSVVYDPVVQELFFFETYHICSSAFA